MEFTHRSRSTRRRPVYAVLAFASIAVASWMFAVGAVASAKGASVINVDCRADSKALAVAYASATTGDTLAIHGTCTGALNIDKDITLAGTGGAVLDGLGQEIRVITIFSGTVVIDGLTIRGGDGFAGVGIHNLGTLTLTNSRVTGNSATNWGGGIYNRYGATLTIAGSSITGNSATGNGGGIMNDGALTITDSTVSGNTGGQGGGGVQNSAYGTLDLASSVIDGNSAQYGGGLANNGALRVVDTTISSNQADYGGGVELEGGRTLIERTTIAGNQAATHGGGVNQLGGFYWSGWLPPVLRSSTVFGNSAGGSGGGVANTGYIGGITLEYVTVAENSAASSGAGIANPGFEGQVKLSATIVASGNAGQNCSGPISDLGYNVENGASCGLTGTGSQSGIDPLLDPDGLAENGGPTRTVALLYSSPAIDAVPSSSGGCGTSVTIDQRGVSRPQGAGCDVGAFELVPDTTSPELTVSLSPTLLWPPTHRYVTVKATVTATDDTDSNPTIELVSVTSNEPDNGVNDGNTVNDIVIEPAIAHAYSDTFQLRAERDGLSNGRIYTITYKATDASNNSAAKSATVTVPISH